MQILFSDESLVVVFALVFMALLYETISARREHRPSLAFAYLFPVGVFIVIYFRLSLVPGLTRASEDELALVVRPALVWLVVILAIQYSRNWLARWAQHLVPPLVAMRTRLNLLRKKLQ